MDEYTNEEKMEFLQNAISLYRQADALKKDADTLMARCGVRICGSGPILRTAYEVDAEESIQVYTGITKLATLLGQIVRHPRDIFKTGYEENEAAVVYDGILFFQLGDVLPGETKYIFR